MSDGVKTHRDGHILEVTLERGKVNAIDVPTSQALAAAFKQLYEDKIYVAQYSLVAGKRFFLPAGTLRL